MEMHLASLMFKEINIDIKQAEETGYREGKDKHGKMTLKWCHCGFLLVN